MSSSLAFHLQKQAKNSASGNLPSPPSSSCEEDGKDEASLTLQSTHFDVLTLERYSSSLPENYTIDHSSPIPIRSLQRPSHSPPQSAASAGTSLANQYHASRDDLSESPGADTYRCATCGKVYKHPNCLAKHRWEHSYQWELTSKLLLTKHQQVQMLEAAAILVGMDTARATSDPNEADDIIFDDQV